MAHSPTEMDVEIFSLEVEAMRRRRAGLPYWFSLPYWFEMADQYGIRVAVARIMDRYRTAEERAGVAKQLLRMMIQLRDEMVAGIAHMSDHPVISEQLFLHAQTRRTETQADRLRILSTRPPNVFVNIVPAVRLDGRKLPISFVLKLPCSIKDIIVYRTVQRTPEATGMAAYQLVSIFTEITISADKTIVHVWDNIIAEENLWDHLSADGQRGFMEEIDFENCIIPPKSRCRMRKGANAIAREVIDEMWGVGWKTEFDPAERVLGGATEGFLTQLAAMAKQGWGIHGVRGVLDDDDDKLRGW